MAWWKCYSRGYGKVDCRIALYFPDYLDNIEIGNEAVGWAVEGDLLGVRVKAFEGDEPELSTPSRYN
jgi:hypothetical protein